MTTSTLGRNSFSNNAKRSQKQCTTKLTTGVRGIRHKFNITQKERELSDADFANIWMKNRSQAARGAPRQ